MGTFYRRASQFIASPVFFILTLVAFVAQASWIAVSARYPMAFDEAYHLGLIKIQAQSLSPIITHQPPGPAVYGALTRDPSYLYHWLMTFPYRLVTAVTPNFTNQVITLRLINVTLFTSGLVLFWLALRKTTASRAAINLALLFFSLTPVASLLAAHINYDNLLMPCVAGSLLLVLNFRQKLLDKHQFSTRSLASLVILGCLSSLVKFPYLPILTGLVLYLGFLLWAVSHRGRRSLHLWKGVKRDWRSVPRWQKTALLVGIVISVGLFTYTYGVNLVEYQNPIPQCGQVLGAARCQAYGPWARNYRAAHHIVNNPNLSYFAINWVAGMFERLFFVINGPGGPDTYQNYIAPIIAGTAALGGAFGLAVFTKNGRRNLEYNRPLTVMLFITTIYLIALWGRNFHDYLQLGQLIAINGRYLIPVILPFYLAAAIGWQQCLTTKNQRLKLGLASAALLLCIQGGGFISYLAYSNPHWYWSNWPGIIRANQNLQKVVKPLVWAPKIR